MEESRTKNSLQNIKTGAIVQIINKLMAFVVRTVFIKILNTEYLGVNGLFTNILTMLSFAELGIGTAIVFNMYKPIAEDNKSKIKSLMKLYKTAYTAIGIVVFVLGLLVIPFMKYIIKDAPNIKENLIFIYILFLINTSSSYFFTYKKSIITAYQKQSVINNIDSVVYLVKSIAEILLLVLTKNYIVYLIADIGSTILENIIVAHRADKMYPFINDKNVKEISKKEKKSIFNNVKALFIYKLGEVILNGTDNILISSMVGVSAVGLCSNYTMMIQAIKGIVFNALSGVTASVGNLNVSDDNKKKEKIYYQLTFVNYIVYSFCAIAFIVLLNPFIKLWLGEKYLFPIDVSIALSVSFFIDGIRNPGYIFRTTLGLFSKAQITPYIGATVNIITSVLLCKKFGVVGIFIGTSIAQLSSYVWIDPVLIYKYTFKKSPLPYFMTILKYYVLFTINLLITFFIANLVKFEGISSLLVKAIVVAIIPNVFNILVLFKTNEFKDTYNKVVEPVVNKLKKK